MSAPHFTVTAERVGNLTEYVVTRDGASEPVAVLHDADLARAIAAHADLYAALEAIEAFTDEYGPKVSPGFSQDYEHARKLYVQARAALARARGEA